jgi:hypothetical protein
MHGDVLPLTNPRPDVAAQICVQNVAEKAGYKDIKPTPCRQMLFILKTIAENKSF